MLTRSVRRLFAVLYLSKIVLFQANIPAAYLSGTMEWQEQNEILRNVETYKLLYVTPEKIAKYVF